MAYVNTTPAVIRHSLTSEIFQAVKSVFARHKLYMQTVAELNDLSDRELADLGIARQSIRALARAAACGQK